MVDFVLMHGAWHGAWCWQRVRTEPGWQVHELAAGDDAMISAPRALLDPLLPLRGGAR